MKKLFLLSVLMSASLYVFSQHKIENIKSKDLIFIFNNINQHFHFENKINSFNFYLVKQRSIKYYFNETEETLSDLYVGISEFDEQPLQQLFRISNVISIDTNNIKINEIGNKYIDIKYKIIENGKDVKLLSSKLFFK